MKKWYPEFITKPYVKKRLLQAIKDGCSDQAACGLAGIPPTVFAEWVRKGIRDPKGLTAYGKLYLEVNRAKGEREEKLIKGIMEADHWKAQAWVLEKLHEAFADRKLMEVTQGRLAPDDIRQLQSLSDEQLKALSEGKSLEDVLEDQTAQLESENVIDVDYENLN